MKFKILRIFLFITLAQGAISQTVSIPALQIVNYKYHIRGGLVGINLDGSSNPVPNYNEGDLFSYKLEYETASKWNGNVGKQSWARATDLALPCNIDYRSYTFTYDPAQRLTAATYSGTGNYSLSSISYDKNSNITGLQRNGWLGSGHGLIDNLGYGYTGNRLTSVTDAIGGDHTVDLAPKLSGARTYYEDGSLKSDENKAVTNIIYDAFTMQPTEITLTGGRWIKMVYLADGTLLKRTYSTGEEWIYTSGMVFLNGEPYSMPIPEGRAIYEAGSWKYEFFITDHLGNIRVTFSEESGKLKEKSIQDYDPTGVEHQNSNISIGGFKPDLFKFQDKESLSNNFGLGGLHDFGPRMLDKTLGGIWSQPDILSELNETQSPFSYLGGRYLNMIDPTGMDDEDPEKKKKVIITQNPGSMEDIPSQSSIPSGQIPLNHYQWPMNGPNSSRDATIVNNLRPQTANPIQEPQYQRTQATLSAPLTAEEYRKKYDPAYEYTEARLTGHLVEMFALKKLFSYGLKNAKNWFTFGKVAGKGVKFTQSAADDLVVALKKQYGGNVTVIKDGVDIFRVHQPGSHGSNISTITKIIEHYSPKGPIRRAASEISSFDQSVFEMLNKAANGQGGYSIRTLRGR